ncbi:hypothetical protein MW402_24885 (plasmid) [Escherichia coli]|uniref:hypothetical protein n=1 Tax=Escherichia coli TaxID=562 RepID=UPI0022826B10|nr:hypothetical protein [Escherichia coli]WAH34854.1 hypothetical protein MW402_24885 [Escherichia coli]
MKRKKKKDKNSKITQKGKKRPKKSTKKKKTKITKTGKKQKKIIKLPICGKKKKKGRKKSPPPLGEKKKKRHGGPPGGVFGRVGLIKKITLSGGYQTATEKETKPGFFVIFFFLPLCVVLGPTSEMGLEFGYNIPRKAPKNK